LPRQLVVFGVEGAKFDVGDELTPEVRAASVRAAEAIREEVLACTSTR
jgi:Ni,Fe-hydrogenase maturation factor